jgi:HSP20 family molecular chaperone IbpA
MSNFKNYYIEDIGFFNNFFNDIDQNYYNQNYDYSINEISNKKILLEVALPGYDKNSIVVESTKNKITIRKKVLKDKKEKTELLKAFDLNGNIEISNATLKNGLLTIILTKIVPEDDIPKLIAIN